MLNLKAVSLPLPLRRSVHANIKPHICKVCDAAFKRKALVRSHLLVAHGITLPTTRVKKFDEINEVRRLMKPMR